jgi:hypothetical protein
VEFNGVFLAFLYRKTRFLAFGFSKTQVFWLFLSYLAFLGAKIKNPGFSGW